MCVFAYIIVSLAVPSLSQLFQCVDVSEAIAGLQQLPHAPKPTEKLIANKCKCTVLFTLVVFVYF